MVSPNDCIARHVGIPRNSRREDLILERLALLPDVESRIKSLTRHYLLTPLTVRRLDEAVSRLVRIDLSKACRLAATAVTLANRLGDAESRAYAARAMANSLWFRGRNEQAAQNHSRAKELFERAGNSIEAGRTLSSSIQPLILLGKYDRALDAAKRAKKIFSAAGAQVRLARSISILAISSTARTDFARRWHAMSRPTHGCFQLETPKASLPLSTMLPSA